jgi:hypothetical protein
MHAEIWSVLKAAANDSTDSERLTTGTIKSCREPCRDGCREMANLRSFDLSTEGVAIVRIFGLANQTHLYGDEISPVARRSRDA